VQTVPRAHTYTSSYLKHKGSSFAKGKTAGKRSSPFTLM
jgi:hypothetical protein